LSIAHLIAFTAGLLLLYYGAGWLVRKLGSGLRFLQTGRVQFYALFIVVMIVVLIFSKFDPNQFWAEWWPLIVLSFLSATLLLGLIARAMKAKGDSAE